ncbi:somatostatin receptor type 4-like [Physella acuta]|uniref:somatostatin receptor type 4-like n=1 Tax=Physella acuta TaxID=109671 RepID=UPI0027DC2BBD|nr:somatostatin receptor type 4-like [Physella acuta]
MAVFKDDENSSNVTYEDSPVLEFDVISVEALHIADILINCVLINAICLLGIVGNVLNVLVLHQRKKRTPTNYVMMSLSVCDLVYVITLILRRSSCVIAAFDVTGSMTMEAVQSAYFLTINTLFRKFSTGHIVLLSLERMIAVYLPLKAALYFSSKKTAYYMMAIALFWIALVCPLFSYMFELKWVYLEQFNTTVGEAVFSNFILQNWDALSILNITTDWIKGPLQFIIISMLSLCTVLKLKDYNRKRMSLTSTQVIDVRAAKMLLAVCLAYLLTSCPTFVPPIFYLVRPELMSQMDGESRLGILLEMVTDFLGAISASVNFVIYVAMSKNFFRTYQHLRCKR